MTVEHPLFSAADLKTPVGRTVEEEEAAHAERIVWGQLKGPLGLTERPAEAGDDVWGWAVQLGAIYLINPGGLSERQLGTSVKKFSSERQAQILEEASNGGTGTASHPQGTFPPARRYPDPAERPCW